jgi:MoxR-like ATPase
MSLQAKFRLEAHLKSLVVGQEAVESHARGAPLRQASAREGAPGLAKTRAIKVLSHSIGDFHRLHSAGSVARRSHGRGDLSAAGQHVRAGPLFHNRAGGRRSRTGQSKSALLEAMGERQITVGSVTYPLPALFMVMAAGIRSTSTYPLPGAARPVLLHVFVVPMPR